MDAKCEGRKEGRGKEGEEEKERLRGLILDLKSKRGPSGVGRVAGLLFPTNLQQRLGFLWH